MKREKELVKNTIVLAIGSFLPRMVSIITIPILTACLSKKEYGVYDLLSTLVMLVIPIATLQIQSAAFRFLIDCRENIEEVKKIITNIFVLTIPIAIGVSFLIIFFFPSMNDLERLLISGYFLCDVVYTMIGQIVRGLSYNKIFSLGAIILAIIDCLNIVLLVFIFDKGLIGVLFSSCLSRAVAIIFQCQHIKLVGFIDFSQVSMKKIREMISYSWPMIPNNLSNWVLKLSDRLIISVVLGVEANAIYAIANKIPSLLSMGQSVMIAAWQENASIALNDKNVNEYYSVMFDRIFKMVLGFTALIIGFMPVLFTTLVKGEYEEAYIQMPILIIGMFFACMSSFQGGIYIAHKKTVSVGITTILAAGINIVVHLLLINKLGIMAGSVSTLVAYFFLYFFRVFDVRRFQKISYVFRTQIFLLIIIIVMLFICAQRTYFCNVINMIVGIFLCMVLNKDVVISIIKRIPKRL